MKQAWVVLSNLSRDEAAINWRTTYDTLDRAREACATNNLELNRVGLYYRIVRIDYEVIPIDESEAA